MLIFFMSILFLIIDLYKVQISILLEILKININFYFYKLN